MVSESLFMYQDSLEAGNSLRNVPIKILRNFPVKSGSRCPQGPIFGCLSHLALFKVFQSWAYFDLNHKIPVRLGVTNHDWGWRTPRGPLLGPSSHLTFFQSVSILSFLGLAWYFYSLLIKMAPDLITWFWKMSGPSSALQNLIKYPTMKVRFPCAPEYVPRNPRGVKKFTKIFHK